MDGWLSDIGTRKIDADMLDLWSEDKRRGNLDMPRPVWTGPLVASVFQTCQAVSVVLQHRLQLSFIRLSRLIQYMAH